MPWKDQHKQRVKSVSQYFVTSQECLLLSDPRLFVPTEYVRFWLYINVLESINNFLKQFFSKRYINKSE